MSKEIIAYACSICESLYEEKDDAEECCPKHVNECIAYCCECGELYYEKEDADMCCIINDE